MQLGSTDASEIIF